MDTPPIFCPFSLSRLASRQRRYEPMYETSSSSVCEEVIERFKALVIACGNDDSAYLPADPGSPSIIVATRFSVQIILIFRPAASPNPI
jgi:hypothetical protein